MIDNCATHTTPAVRTGSWAIRFFISTHSSWLNQVERWFAKITTAAIRRGSFRSVFDLRQTIMAYIEANNRPSKPFIWIAKVYLIL